MFSALTSWFVSTWSVLRVVRHSRARRAFAVFVAGSLAIGCIESVAEAASMSLAGVAVACGSDGLYSPQAAPAVAPAPDCDGRPGGGRTGDLPVSAGHQCACARAVVAFVPAAQLAVVIVPTSVAPIVREDRAPPSPAPERRLRPPVGRVD